MTKTLAVVGMGPGIGMSIARRFGREGFSVGMIGRRAQALGHYAGDLKKEGIAGSGFAADVVDAAALNRALDRIAAEIGAIDVLVYNAGVMRMNPIEQLTQEEFVDDFRVHVGGALLAAQKVIPAMRQRRSGSILLTGGGFALEPVPLLASSGVGKAGIRNLAFSLYAELKDSGVHAATVTIAGAVQRGTPFDPDLIADQFWALHAQGPNAFEREIVVR